MTFDHDSLDELLGAYALDAVDEAEREQLDEYIRRNPRARAEADELRLVAAALGNSTAEAPPTIWTRIEQALGTSSTDANGFSEDEETDLPPLALLENRRRTSPFGRTRPRGLPFDTRGVAARTRFSPVTAAAAVAAVVFGVAAIAQQSRIADLRSEQSAARVASERLADERDEARQTLARVRSEATDAKAELVALRSKDLNLERLLANENTKRVPLESSDGRVIARILIGQNGESYLVNEGLPKLPDGRTYQLWGFQGETILSLGVFGQKPSAVAFAANSRWTQFAITVEASPGVASSSQLPFAAGAVSV